MRSRRQRLLAAIVIAGAVTAPAWSQTAIELKKDLAPKYKKAEAEGKDLGEAGKAYKAGDEAMKKGLQEEAVEHFTRAKELWPADSK
jgi:hypothetical protein